MHVCIYLYVCNILRTYYIHAYMLCVCVCVSTRSRMYAYYIMDTYTQRRVRIDYRRTQTLVGGHFFCFGARCVVVSLAVMAGHDAVDLELIIIEQCPIIS